LPAADIHKLHHLAATLSLAPQPPQE
jgi:hypothetical protein